MTAHARRDSDGISRRNFARLLAAGGSAALLGKTGGGRFISAKQPPPREKDWSTYGLGI